MERSMSNCTGDHRYGKRKLSPTRMEAVKDAVFSIYPIRPGDSKADQWRTYKIVIDSSCRQLNHYKKVISKTGYNFYFDFYVLLTIYFSTCIIFI